MTKLALVKLGGSVITYKDKPLSANLGAIEGIARVLAELEIPAIIVHGGGSYGHHWSVKYDMHTRPAPYDAHGVAVVHESMVALNQIIVNALIKAGANPYAVAPPVYAAGHRPIASKIDGLCTMARNGVMPVTFGDVVHIGGRKYSILSGDSLMSILAGALRPSRIVFATNVDGIYRDMETKEIVPELHPGSSSSRRGAQKKEGKQRPLFSKTDDGVADVTGGMGRKVREAFKIASFGMDVMLVNGLVPERIARAVQDGRAEPCTVIRGRKR
ncbi:MAG: gamma-glutamyl kinase [Nitrososphaera sp.]